MQSWFVESAFLGILRVSFDENVQGLTSNGSVKNGAIVQIEMMQRAKPTKFKSTAYEEFVSALRDYESGSLQAFNELSVQVSGTDFQKEVLRQMRGVEPGSVVTYGDLAKLSGYPKAARAVATVCATNKVPLILPCHRVVPSDLSIGNYASRILKDGSRLKEALLGHEGALI
jgi:methylated-DNA-[protein]-cysteine S-methyltransferase